MRYASFITKITVYVFQPYIFLFKRKMQKKKIPLKSAFEAQNYYTTLTVSLAKTSNATAFKT